MGTKRVSYENNDGTIVSKEYKTIDKFNEDGYLVDSRRNSLKNEYKLLPRELTKAERGDLTDLRTLIGKDQLLVYKSNGKYQPHTCTTIAKFLNGTERQVKRLLRKACEYNVIAEIKINDVKYYMYNPYYERAVRRISFIVYLAFQDSVLRETIEPRYRSLLQKQIQTTNQKIEVIKNDKKNSI